jgi:hypothetical protein
MGITYVNKEGNFMPLRKTLALKIISAHGLLISAASEINTGGSFSFALAKT